MKKKKQILSLIYISLFCGFSIALVGISSQDSVNHNQLSIQDEIILLLEEATRLSDEDIKQKQLLFDKAIRLAEDNGLPEQTARIYYDLGIAQFRANQFNQALASYQKAKNYYDKNHDFYNLRKVLEEEGYCFQRLGNLDDAEKMFKSDLELSTYINNDSTTSIAITNLGHIEWRKGNFEEALSQFNKALDLRRKLKIDLEIASSLNNIGSVYWKRGQYAFALKNFLESLKIREEFNDSLGMIISLNNIGSIYQKIHHFEKAEEFFQIGLSQSVKSNYKFGESYSFYNLGLLSAANNNFDEAINFYNRSLSISTEIGDLNLSMMTEIHLGESYFAQNDYSSAIKYFGLALTKSEKFNDSFVLAKANNCMAKILYKLDKNNTQVLIHLDISTRICELENIQEIKIDNYQLYYEVYQNRGETLKSLEYYKRRSEVQEKVINEKLINNIADMLILFEIRKSAIEIELLKNEKQLQSAELEAEKYLRNLVIGLIFAAVAIIVVLIITFRNKIKFSDKIAHQKLQLEELNSELTIKNKDLQKSNDTKNRLFSIVSHDLRNPAGALQNYSTLLIEGDKYIDQSELKEIYLSIRQSSETMITLIDDLLDWARSQSESFQLNKSIVKVDDIFTSVNSVYKNFARFKNIEFIIQIDSEIYILVDKRLIDSVIRNLVSNALKYTHEGGKIYLIAEIENNKCKISVIDTGIGILETVIEDIVNGKSIKSAKGTNNETGTGLGINLSKEFLELHDSKLEVASKIGEWTKFWFYLPLKKTD